MNHLLPGTNPLTRLTFSQRGLTNNLPLPLQSNKTSAQEPKKIRCMDLQHSSSGGDAIVNTNALDIVVDSATKILDNPLVNPSIVNTTSSSRSLAKTIKLAVTPCG
ncbi:hypothetical protein O6H91_10G053000 [Diphasiastrum complanatum]|uniref:Uncharacterized protein n=1 Tax=Diphasiastrum complanatum TaxID=34168 RepID=A0ACC2CHC4_DIPCM|nr:hypothetical protein O6H91_10G053000 [Diphasiastrum complanatum]